MNLFIYTRAIFDHNLFFGKAIIGNNFVTLGSNTLEHIFVVFNFQFSLEKTSNRNLDFD
jgi:hypothetical protein